ncbi:hypothetical protein [uncultured Helcococcus sp.]|uniref:hypothetical protein n=2 Tax=uncultured Helcococcus sp. TaxID=1072508 RepID=UPI00288BACE2|nr:hypothetical protein [uncultured Helcococcus sp.]
MISIISRKIKENRGSVEFIESSLLMPFLFLLLSLLFIISLKTVNKSIASENIYYKTSIIMDQVSEDFEIWKKIDQKLLTNAEIDLNTKLSRLSQKPIDLESKENMFKNTISVSQDSEANKYNFSKLYLIDSKRKIDFVNFIYKEFNDKEIGGIKLSDIFTSKNPLIEKMVGR